MRNVIEATALRLSMCLGILYFSLSAQAQDPEEGAVDLNETSPAAESAPARSAPAWDDAPTIRSDDDEAQREERSEEVGGRGRLRVWAGARLGLGGGFRPENANYISLARPTPGIQLGADYVLHKYFGIGLETDLRWSAPRAGNGFSYMLWDLWAKPRAAYPLKAKPIELYLAVPGGVSVSQPGKDYEDGKLGASVGLFMGASYFFNDHWAVNAELGFLWTFLRYKTLQLRPAPVGTGVPAQVVPADLKITLGQLNLAVNLLYAF